MNLLNRASGLRRYPAVRYLFAMAASAVALVVRLRLDSDLPPGFPFLTFFPAVIVTAFVAGLGPGILCSALSGLAAWYFFVPPFHSFDVTAQTGLALAFYLFIVTVDLTVIHLMFVSAHKLRAERELTSTLYDQQRTMFQELQHRVANNMAFIAAILQLEQRRSPRSGEVADALGSAILRVDTMSRIHRRLYDPDTAGRSLQADFKALAYDLVAITGRTGIDVSVKADPVTIELPRLITLSQLVAEVVMNSLKHAFPDGAGGRISIALTRHDASRLELVISDNGRGLGGAPPRPGGGLGGRIVENLGAQLGGKVSVVDAGGVTTRLVFPG